MPLRKRAIQPNENDVDATCVKQNKVNDSGFTTFTQVAKLGNGSFGNVQIWINYSTSKIYAGKMFSNKDDFLREYAQVFKLKPVFPREEEQDSKLKYANVLTPVKVLENANVILYNLYSYNLEEMLLNRTKIFLVYLRT